MKKLIVPTTYTPKDFEKFCADNIVALKNNAVLRIRASREKGGSDCACDRCIGKFTATEFLTHIFSSTPDLKMPVERAVDACIEMIPRLLEAGASFSVAIIDALNGCLRGNAIKAACDTGMDSKEATLELMKGLGLEGAEMEVHVVGCPDGKVHTLDEMPPMKTVKPSPHDGKLDDILASMKAKAAATENN